MCIKSIYMQGGEFDPNQTITCSDYLSPTAASWEKVVDAPPTTLEESYSSCRKTSVNAFFDSLGVAAGNASTLSPLLVLILVNLYIVIMMLRNKDHSDHKVKSWEKDEMIDAIATKLVKRRRLRENEESRTKAYPALTGATTSMSSSSKDTILDDLYDAIASDVARAHGGPIPNITGAKVELTSLPVSGAINPLKPLVNGAEKEAGRPV